MRGLAARLAIVVTAGAAHAATAHAAPGECEPAVRVSGDRSVAEPIRASLAGHGLVDDATGRCPLLHARVERHGEMLKVEVTDSYGRRSQREVRDADTAIALIESWVRPEVVDAELPGMVPMEATSPPPPPADGPVAARTIAVRTSANVPATTGLALVAGATYADDGTTWMRVDAAGCRGLGRVCIGGRAGIARDLGLASSPHPRTRASAGVLVEVALPLGGFAVAPGVGIGVGWDHVSAIGPHMDQSEDIASLRIGATCAVRRGIGRRWAVSAEVGADGTVMGGAAIVPGTMGRVGLGLRYGGR